MHSLAALIFVMLCGGNALNGKREYNIKIFDGVAAQEIYGKNPVFVFDPDNRSNRLPDERGYRHISKRWKVLPTEIRKLFTKAFTTGLKDPAKRVTDLEWQNALTRMLGQRHVCSCGAENFWDPYRKKQKPCWHKDCSVTFPCKLYVQGKSTTAILAKPGHSLTTLHFGEKSSATVVGEMEKHPTDASLVILRNKSAETWIAKLSDQNVDIQPERAIPLHPGLRINISKHEVAVYP